MIEWKKDWEEFSEWYDRVKKPFKKNPSPEKFEFEALEDDVSMNQLMESIKQWIHKIEEAPQTTWKEELSVRGYDFEYSKDDSNAIVFGNLNKLLTALAGMHIFITNTDHLSDRELLQIMLDKFIIQPVALIPFDQHTGCVIDIVGSEVEDDPSNWLRYYANEQERKEWSMQNAEKELPAKETPPYPREEHLPKP